MSTTEDLVAGIINISAVLYYTTQVYRVRTNIFYALLFFSRSACLYLRSMELMADSFSCLAEKSG